MGAPETPVFGIWGPSGEREERGDKPLILTRFFDPFGSADSLVKKFVVEGVLAEKFLKIRADFGRARQDLALRALRCPARASHRQARARHTIEHPQS